MWKRAIRWPIAYLQCSGVWGNGGADQRWDKLSVNDVWVEIPPLLRFSGGPHRHFLPSMLHIGMALIKQVLRPLPDLGESKLCRVFIYRHSTKVHVYRHQKHPIDNQHVGVHWQGNWCNLCLMSGGFGGTYYMGMLGVDGEVSGIEQVTVQLTWSVSSAFITKQWAIHQILSISVNFNPYEGRDPSADAKCSHSPWRQQAKHASIYSKLTKVFAYHKSQVYNLCHLLTKC